LMASSIMQISPFARGHQKSPAVSETAGDETAAWSQMTYLFF